MSVVPDPKPAIQAELQRIEEDCIHSGKAHFNAGDRWARYHYWFGIPSVVLSALAGAAFFKDYCDISGFMSAVVAIFSCIFGGWLCATDLSRPHQEVRRHLLCKLGHQAVIAKRGSSAQPHQV